MSMTKILKTEMSTIDLEMEQLELSSVTDGSIKRNRTGDVA